VNGRIVSLMIFSFSFIIFGDDVNVDVEEDSPIGGVTLLISVEVLVFWVVEGDVAIVFIEDATRYEKRFIKTTVSFDYDHLTCSCNCHALTRTLFIARY
jgi:hypothetical protein